MVDRKTVMLFEWDPKKATDKREDLAVGVRDKYFEFYHSGTNLVLISPDGAKVFFTQQAFNEALRTLISLAEKSTGRTSRSTGSPKKRASR